MRGVFMSLKIMLDTLTGMWYGLINEKENDMHKENLPNFYRLNNIQSRHWGPDVSVPNFIASRQKCVDLGLTLERHNTGYFLSGLDLPPSGVHCRNLAEVDDELVNYE